MYRMRSTVLHAPWLLPVQQLQPSPYVPATYPSAHHPAPEVNTQRALLSPKPTAQVAPRRIMLVLPGGVLRED